MKRIFFSLAATTSLCQAVATTSPTTFTNDPTTNAPTTTTSAPSTATTKQPTGAPTTGAPTTTVVTNTSAPTLDSNVTNVDMTDIPAAVIALKCNLTVSPSYEQFAAMNPPICVVVSDRNYTMFYPQVDDFSLLEVDGSFNKAWLDGGDETFIRVEVGNVTSKWRRRSEGTGSNKIVIPFWTMILEAKDGAVDRLTWDDGCLGCDMDDTKDKCVDNHACGHTLQECTDQTEENRIDCDLKLYFGWYGTDKNGRYFTSAGKRLSRFRGASLMGAYKNAVKGTLDLKDKIVDGVTG